MKSILILLLLILLTCCDDTFDGIPPGSCELFQVRIEYTPALRIEGRPWDEDLAPEYSYTIVDSDLHAISDTSEVISCNPMLLPLMIKSQDFHLETRKYYKLVIIDQDYPGLGEVIASIEFSPMSIGYNKKKTPKYFLSNQHLSATIFLKWNDDPLQ